MSRLSRIALRAYPPSFRARYGAEMAALVEDLPCSERTTADLFAGAARAWLRPSFTGETALRQRLSASAATTWAAWCLAFCVVPAMSKALLDPPPAGPHGGIWALMNLATGFVVAGWICALTGAGALVVKALVPALRSPQRRSLLPLLPALWLGLLDGAALAAWIEASHGHAERLVRPVGSVGALIAILIGFLAFLIALGTGPAATLRRLDTRLAHLKIAAVLAVPVALLLTAATACCVIAALVSAAPGAVIFGNSVVPPLVLAFASVASLVALVSSARGVQALRRA